MPATSPAEPVVAADAVTIDGTKVIARSPEGVVAEMEITELMRRLTNRRPNSNDLVLPDGVRLMFSRGTTTIMVYEVPPQVHRLKWIAQEPADLFGTPDTPGGPAGYKERRLALPYLVLFVVFGERGGNMLLSGRNEAYFRTEPITSADDELCFPALLNVSRYDESVAASSSLAWICTQYLDYSALAAEEDANTRVRASLRALRHTMLETGFNYSSEQHELESYWTTSARTIPQVADLGRWEELTHENPLFVLDVPWLEATWQDKRMTVRSLAERIFGLCGAKDDPAASAGDLARVVFNGSANGNDRRRRRRKPSAPDTDPKETT